MKSYMLSSSLKNLSDYYYINQSVNQNKANDNFFYTFSPDLFDSVQTVMHYSYLQTTNASVWQGFDNAIISIKISMDEKVSTTTRKTYKIYDVLGQIGGFWSTVYITFYVIVNRFQTYIYQSNILTSLYVTSKKKKKKSQVAVEFFTPPEIKEPVTEFERMKKEIFSRKSYIFGFWNVFKLPFTRLRCLWSKITFEKFAKKKKIFEQGWERVQ